MNYKLKKCPFCENSQVEVAFVENIDMDEQYRCLCGACGSHTPIYGSKEEASKIWNQRVDHRDKGNCPFCNSAVKLEEFEIKAGGNKYYKHHCQECGFESGFSQDKETVINLWYQNSSKE